jgi:hypothetical protein
MAKSGALAIHQLFQSVKSSTPRLTLPSSCFFPLGDASPSRMDQVHVRRFTTGNKKDDDVRQRVSIVGEMLELLWAPPLEREELAGLNGRYLAADGAVVLFVIWLPEQLVSPTDDRFDIRKIGEPRLQETVGGKQPERTVWVTPQLNIIVQNSIHTDLSFALVWIGVD